MKKALKSILCTVLAGCLLLAASGCAKNSSKSAMDTTETKTFDTKKDGLKVGIISDTQLPPTEKALASSDKYLKNLKKALNVFKENDVDMILFAGDIGDLGTRFAFQTYADALQEVFGEDMPIVQTIMGNHDHWNKNVFTAINHQKAFEEILGQSPWTHYVVNGYHFIGASPDSGNMSEGYKDTVEWLEQELQKASADSAGKPIFVMTHNQPENTSYGSEDWGDTTLDAVFKKYPNVINFSGHVHYSLLDERSVWQGAYTVINTQSLSYTEMEVGKENGSIPPHADETPMGYIMEIADSGIGLHRVNFADGTEQKADRLWTFPMPYENDGRFAFDTRKAENKAPTMVANAEASATVDGDKVVLRFLAGADDDFVHSYKVVVDDKDEKLFFSDFYNGLGAMTDTVTLELKSDGNKHQYKIYAVDSWGAVSEGFVTVTQE